MNEEGIIALDELLLHEAPCSVVGPTDAPDTRMICDFEEDLCGFKLEDEHGKWIWTYPNSPDNDFPHPSRDHTYYTGYGHYLAAPLEDDREGVVGRVVSPEYSQERHEKQCLVFWYIHNGNTDRDVLEVYVKHGLTVFPRAAWRENANHMYTWMRANIAIPSGRSHFSVIWRAVQRKRDNKGVFALDDVEILEKECPNIVGTCGWQNLNQTENVTDETDWIQSSGDDGLNGISPPDDHTGDTKGKFLYVDGKNGTTGTAVLESQLLTPEQHSDFCFSFWFFIDGVPADEISISSVVSMAPKKSFGSMTVLARGGLRANCTSAAEEPRQLPSSPWTISPSRGSLSAKRPLSFTTHNSGHAYALGMYLYPRRLLWDDTHWAGLWDFNEDNSALNHGAGRTPPV
ncbi:hypothetical protein C7M84_008951 [Penaeus vannamei]|uniref:MAM domain-containing protein n=1 Tax=Penaeus vannamei TaxID=6689 RepID=A0A3R7QMZ5_PENVA|nr:hypothetical protein C7M84_008951 [Penaeus vannamei]